MVVEEREHRERKDNCENICPRCGSKDEMEWPGEATLKDAPWLTYAFICRVCGCVGTEECEIVYRYTLFKEEDDDGKGEEDSEGTTSGTVEIA